MSGLYALQEAGIWKIIGNTYDYKEAFKQAGLMWDAAEKAWCCYDAQLPAAIAAIVKQVHDSPANGVRTVDRVIERTIEVEVEKVVEKPVYLNHTRHTRAGRLTRKRTAARKTLVNRVEAEAPGGMVKPSFWGELCMYITPGACRPAIALVGPAGNGKTTVAKAAMAAMGYAYVEIDCTEYTEPADLIGGMLIKAENGGTSSVWVDGAITRAFKEGMGIILNEYDALNPRAALCLQSVFQDAGRDAQGRYVTTVGCPEHDRVYPAGDCPAILSLNTYGMGGSRQYVGRNTMDAASMDRLTILTTGYENESAILVAHGYTQDTARRLEIWAAGVRKQIDGNQLKIILSNRTLIRLAQAIDSYGWSWETAIDKEFMSRFDKAQGDVIRQAAYNIPPARVVRAEKTQRPAPSSTSGKKRQPQDTASAIDAMLSQSAAFPHLQNAADMAKSMAAAGTLSMDVALDLANQAQAAARKARGQS